MKYDDNWVVFFLCKIVTHDLCLPSVVAKFKQLTDTQMLESCVQEKMLIVHATNKSCLTANRRKCHKQIEKMEVFKIQKKSQSISCKMAIFNDGKMTKNIRTKKSTKAYTMYAEYARCNCVRVRDKEKTTTAVALTL